MCGFAAASHEARAAKFLKRIGDTSYRLKRLDLEGAHGNLTGFPSRNTCRQPAADHKF
jgi:hypothetical protein